MKIQIYIRIKNNITLVQHRYTRNLSHPLLLFHLHFSVDLILFVRVVSVQMNTDSLGPQIEECEEGTTGFLV